MYAASVQPGLDTIRELAARETLPTMPRGAPVP
jgi:hypothetical protein